MGPDSWLYERSTLVMFVKLDAHWLGRQPVKELLFTCISHTSDQTCLPTYLADHTSTLLPIGRCSQLLSGNLERSIVHLMLCHRHLSSKCEKCVLGFHVSEISFKFIATSLDQCSGLKAIPGRFPTRRSCTLAVCR